MYWILFVMGAVVAVLVAVVVGGLATPRQHIVTRAIALPDTIDVVWAVVRDFAQYSEWRHDLEFVEPVATLDPLPQWRETTTRGSITFGVTVEEPPHRMVAKILDDDLPFSGEWRWHLSATGVGTTLAITECGEVSNPVFRFIGTHFLGHTRSIDAYLNSVARHLGSPLTEIRSIDE